MDQIEPRLQVYLVLFVVVYLFALARDAFRKGRVQPGWDPTGSVHHRHSSAEEELRRTQREEVWAKNPGKVFAYFSLGLLCWSLLAELGSVQFRLIFLAVALLVIAGLAYDQHKNGEPGDSFWPSNPVILPVRAVQGLGLAIFGIFLYVAQGLFALSFLLLVAVATFALIGLAYFIALFLVRYFGGWGGP